MSFLFHAHQHLNHTLLLRGTRLGGFLCNAHQHLKLTLLLRGTRLVGHYFMLIRILTSLCSGEEQDSWVSVTSPPVSKPHFALERNKTWGISM